MQRAKILIADPADLTREGLHGLLSAQDDLEVVGTCKTVDEVIERSIALSPEVVLLGYGFPESERLEAVRQIGRNRPWIPVLVLADSLEFDGFLAVVRAGARGYLGREIDGPRLIEAIRTVSSGGCVADPNSTKDVFAYVASRPGGVGSLSGGAPASGSAMSKLTPREREVLRLMAQGRGNKEIGALLGISVGTAKTHVRHIFRKLQVSDRTAAVLVAMDVDPTRILPAA